MGFMTKDQINVSLFDEVKKLRAENEALKSDLHSVMEQILEKVRKMADVNLELTTGQESQAAKG